MKDTEIVEILEDGTIYYFDLEVCNKEAEETLQTLIDKEGVVPNFDLGAAVFTLYINSIYMLSQLGWTQEELIQEVITHSTKDEE